MLVGLLLGLQPVICCSRRGQLLDSFETSHGILRLKVSSYTEAGVIGPGHVFFVFSSIKPNEFAREIMVVRRDDDAALPKSHLRFLGESVAYVFMEDMYAVTTDKGTTWSIWLASKDLANRTRWPRWGSIKNVQLLQDGTGMMSVQAVDPETRATHTAEFHTTDFGRQWD